MLAGAVLAAAIVAPALAGVTVGQGPVATSATAAPPRATPPTPTIPASPAVATASALSPREVDCLAEAVYFEARGESGAGQAAVAQVVMNRTRAGGFPRTVCGVVHQRAGGLCQFSFVCLGLRRSVSESAAWGRSRAVARRALGGYVMTLVGPATSFRAAGPGRPWPRRMSRVSRLGGHVFYCAGAPAPAPAAPVEAGEASSGAS
ncbi:MAG: cell wall hydrolase [Caulobacteraceae bacterium]